ncbi:Cof-type HAD-IIB family hydrolase [Vagococcus zengguangii]|uniref:HAD family phosphatase n=1 Tax=Vagococcus zengguangii TaxID=2571750 RepID=A0A4D7CU12_9ENTE|nr:Cof-type HAD-IIB family hydrolase [Vagococcus zengguangii]QCI85841.1 HAD family phosphatase [Vagococcus zengguangii]TLG81782.1 HAD family phosphatase [Vagococcus zengguangii]
MTTIKAIVLDIDGTLFTSDRQISAKTKQTLLDAQSQGIKVIVASGRPTNGMRHIAKELELAKHHGFLASYNGSRVIDMTNEEVVFDRAIEITIAKEILKHLETFDVIPMINDDTTMYVHDVFNHTITMEDGELFNIIQYEARGGNFLLAEKSSLADFVNFPVNKLLIAGDPDYLAQHHQDIYAPFLEQVTGTFSAPFYFEFTAKNIDKAAALAAVLEPLDIKRHEVIAFGDGLNDLTMLEYAGIGVAMGNAKEEVKAVAQYITQSNDEDGIAHALEKFLN